METRADIKFVRISPKKVRFMLSAIKNMTPVEAMDSLIYSQNRSAKVLYKAIKSAVDNAKNNLKVVDRDLRFKTIFVNQGPVLKRMRAGSKGRAMLYKRRSCHITVILSSNVEKKTIPEAKIKNIQKKEDQEIKTAEKKLTVDKKNN